MLSGFYDSHSSGLVRRKCKVDQHIVKMKSLLSRQEKYLLFLTGSSLDQAQSNLIMYCQASILLVAYALTLFFFVLERNPQTIPMHI